MNTVIAFPKITAKELAESGLNRRVYELFRRGKKMTFSQVRKLKMEEEYKPTLAIQVLLLGYYHSQYRKNVKRREEYLSRVCSFIDSFPTSFLSLFLEYSLDDKNYRKLRGKWLKQTQLNPRNVQILDHAACFCLLLSETDSEKLWRRAKLIDNNPRWSSEVAKLHLKQAERTCSQRSKRRLLRKALQEWREFCQRMKSNNENDLFDSVYENISVQLARQLLGVGLASEAVEIGRSLLDYADHGRSELLHIAHSVLARAFCGNLSLCKFYLEKLLKTEISDDLFFDYCVMEFLVDELEYDLSLKYAKYCQSSYARIAEALRFDKSAAGNQRRKEVKSTLTQISNWTRKIERLKSRLIQ